MYKINIRYKDKPDFFFPKKYNMAKWENPPLGMQTSCGLFS